MIRYCPKRCTVSLSIKDELLFDSLEDLKAHVLDRWQRIASYLGSSDPIRLDDIIIMEPYGDDPLIGLHNARKICVTRTAGPVYPFPLCIGVCGE